ARRPDVAVQLIENKTIRLLPRLLSGSIDLAFVRPPESADKAIEFFFLFPAYASCSAEPECVQNENSLCGRGR
ncbi:MAG TPA: LysR substrate-binding domain-containing protein, partial [Candidatus Acidoferrum sp.]|nr:LysR substrate-binding domain-containing protein [Candidatus Acidoferrum sp.]